MLEAFVAGLLLITISELGDKTFFIAVILACRHTPLLVITGVVAALATMTLLSVGMGQLFSVLPAIYIHWAEVLLFLGFGVKLLIQGWRMPTAAVGACEDVCQEAIKVVKDASADLPEPTQLGVLLQSFSLTFLAEWGDRTQIATIGLAAAKNPWGVTLGAIVGHTICAAIAVLGGQFIAGRISERTITLTGGGLFLLFALLGIQKLIGA